VEIADAPATTGEVADGTTPPSPRGNERERSLILLATIVVTAVLGATASASATALLIGVAVVQAAMIFGWVLGSGMPGRIGAILAAAAASGGADGAVAAWPTSALSPLLATLGLALPVLFVHQLTRGVVRARVVESLSASAALVVSVVALTGFVQLRHEFEGRSMALAAILTVGIALAVGQLTDLVWSRPRLDPAVPRGLVGLVIATIAGAAIGGWLLRDSTVFSRERGVLLSAGVALLAALVSVGTSFVAHGLTVASAVDAAVDDRSEFAVVHPSRPLRRPLPLAIIPFALAAPAAYVLFLSVG
jgi:hypothetical protein